MPLGEAGMHMKNDYVQKILACCQKMESVMLHNLPNWIYNRNFDKIRKYARALIDEGRAAEILPYLHDENLFVRYNFARFFFHCYPEQCRAVLQKLSEMTVATGLPKHLVTMSVSSYDNLKYGIPKDFP